LPILLVGLNHTTAPVEVREKVSFTREQLAEAIPNLRAEAGEGVILSTCNRTEVYTIPDDPEEGSIRVAKFLAKSLNGTGDGVVHEAVLAPYLYTEHGLDAARHLFRVSSGLDSMILGESQILGQVRTAMTTAAEIEPLSADVSRLFHSAIRSGRRARDETDIGKNALTVSYTGVRLLQQTLGDLSDLSVLLVGAGEAGRLVADALTSSGVGQIKVANRTAARADEIAVDLDAEAVPFEDMAGAIKTSDVVITAVDHDEHVLSVDDVSSAVRNRERSLFVLDLGVPRNVDPLVARVDGVILHNIDDLTQVATENLSGRQAAAVNAEKVVEDELARFAVWWDSREATSVIKDVREMAEATRLRELDKALKLMPGLSEQQRANVEAMSRSLVAKLLHQPTVRLKDPAGRPYLQAIKELFGP